MKNSKWFSSYAGVLLVLGAFAFFSFQDALVKWLVVKYSPWELVFARSVILVPFAIVFGGWACVRSAFFSPMRLSIYFRTLLIILSSVLMAYASKSLTLGQLSTIYFLSPVMVVFLSGLFLKENVTGLHWLSLFLGFTGVVIVCQPSISADLLSVFLAFLSAVFWSLSLVFMKSISGRESSSVFVFASAISQCFLGLVMTSSEWRLPAIADLFPLVLLGLTAAVATYLLFEGLKVTRASLIAPLEMTTIVWAFIIGAIVWADYPTLLQCGGVVLILLSGAFVIISDKFSNSVDVQSL